jgi:hypothetical protein
MQIYRFNSFINVGNTYTYGEWRFVFGQNIIIINKN